MLEQTDAITNEVLEAIPSNIPHCIYRVSQNLCHKLFLGIPHPQLSKKVPINMGPKVNRFRDIGYVLLHILPYAKHYS